MADPKRILIVDDHALLREGLRQTINLTGEFIVAGEAASGQEAMRKLNENKYDIVILDVSLPGRDGFAIQQDIKRLDPGLPVLFLSSHPEEQCALRAYRAGAAGYLSKMSPKDEVINALRKIAQGKRYASPEFADALLNNLGKEDVEHPYNTLSNREFQVLCLIASGKPVSRVADELALNVKTVSTYRAIILRKLNMSNNSELTRYAIENKLV